MWINAAACRPTCTYFSFSVIFLIWGFFEQACVVFSIEYCAHALFLLFLLQWKVNICAVRWRKRLEKAFSTRYKSTVVWCGCKIKLVSAPVSLRSLTGMWYICWSQQAIDARQVLMCSSRELAMMSFQLDVGPDLQLNLPLPQNCG